MIDQQKNISEIGAKIAECVRKVNFLASGDRFWSKNLISMAPRGNLIIDQKSILKTFSFFYSYDWRAGTLIIDLKSLFRVRGNIYYQLLEIINDR